MFLRHNQLLFLNNFWLWRRPQNGLGHHTRVVVRNLPLSIFVHINKAVSALHLVSSCTHGELVNSGILTPVVSDDNVALQNLALRLLGQETDEVVLDQAIIRARNIGHGRQQHCILRISLRHRIGIQSGEGSIPKLKQILHFFLRNRLGHRSLGHHTRVMMRNLPLSIFKHINETVPTLHFLSSGTHGKFIDARVLAPVCSNCHVTLENFTLRFQFEKVDEIVLDGGEVCPGNVADCWKENSFLGIPGRHLLGVKSGKGVVPQTEQSTDFVFGNGLAHGNLLGHDAGMVVLDFPDSILFDVIVSVAGFHFISSGTHCELVHSHVARPTISDVNFPIQNFPLRLLEKEGVEVVLH
mmetsp:Transcript_19182/g.37258  ORF Transcript_19182/g.37258 Transcript_19182/m.37258 type:complete len:354 (+) Transcript_19182:142-1203(+)